MTYNPSFSQTVNGKTFSGKGVY